MPELRRASSVEGVHKATERVFSAPGSFSIAVMWSRAAPWRATFFMIAPMGTPMSENMFWNLDGSFRMFM